MFSRRQFIKGVSTAFLAASSMRGEAATSQHSVDATKVRFVAEARNFFGFNIEWLAFQLGYFEDEVIYAAVKEWISQFGGASLRFPGGQKANWFIWELATGPISSRGLQETEGGRKDVAAFGLDEFLSIVSELNFKPLLVCNLVGPRRGMATQSDRSQSLDRLLRHCDEWSYARGAKFPVEWELWNELDWHGHAWTTDKIISRGLAAATTIMNRRQDARLHIPTRTAGFLDENSARQFNRKIATSFQSVASSFTTHIYYDGRPVQDVLRYLETLVGDVREIAGEDSSVFITEHARWPNKPVVGRWEDRWYTTGNLEGALSSGDFILGARAIRGVSGALYHQIGGRGPWQVIHRAPNTNDVWRSVTYWGLLALSVVSFDRVLGWNVDAAPTRGQAYSTRTLVTQDDHYLGIAVVNRSKFHRRIRIQLNGLDGRRLVGSTYFVGASFESAANTRRDPDTVVMKVSPVELNVGNAGGCEIEVPPYTMGGLRLNL